MSGHPRGNRPGGATHEKRAIRIGSWMGLGLLLSFTGCFSAGGGGGGGRVSVQVQEGGGQVMVGGATGQGADFDRAPPPVPGRVPALNLPRAEEILLANGLRVLIVRKAGVPVIHVELQLPGGASALAPGQAGLAGLVAEMLDEGTVSRTALDVAAEVEQLGASLDARGGWDASTVGLTVLRARLEAALELMADVVRNPAFRDADLDRVLGQRRTRALQQMDEPGALADNAFIEALFGTAHPYGQPLLGTRASLETLGREDVLAYYRAHYRPAGATLVVVGPLNAETVRPLLEEAFGSWEGADDGEGAVSRGSGPIHAPSPAIHLVDRPGAPQSEIRVGLVGVERRTDDYFALTVLNTVLGGSFTSRLNQRLREEKGYTYGARSSFAMRLEPGPFTASAAVHTPVTHLAVADFIEEIRRLSDERVGEDELERAKRYVALRLPQQFETSSDIATHLSELALYDLPIDSFNGFSAGILEVTASEVQDMAKRYLDPERLVVVIAGDRATIEEPLRAAGRREVKIVAPPAGP